MFPIQIYEPVYLLIVAIITLFLANRYSKTQMDIPIYRPTGRGISIITCLFLVLFIGTRPIRGMGDTGNFTGYYEIAQGLPFFFSFDTTNLIFDNLLNWFASKSIPVTVFYILISFVYFVSMLAACRKLFPESYPLAFFVCLGAFSTFSYGVNGIKAGAAASIFLLALANIDNLLLCILLSLVSYGFHHSMVVVLVALACTTLFKNTKVYFFIWILCVLIAAAHISTFQVYFASFVDEDGAGYLLANNNDDSAYLTGFRLDFILYSAIPIIVGYWLVFKKKIKNDGYESWLRLYLLMNSLWLLCMYASYTNRIAYLSWFLYPILLIYPFIGFRWDNRQMIYAKRATLYQLLFTLFMALIYYGI